MQQFRLSNENSFRLSDIDGLADKAGKGHPMIVKHDIYQRCSAFFGNQTKYAGVRQEKIHSDDSKDDNSQGLSSEAINSANKASINFILSAVD